MPFIPETTWELQSDTTIIKRITTQPDSEILLTLADKRSEKANLLAGIATNQNQIIIMTAQVSEIDDEIDLMIDAGVTE